MFSMLKRNVCNMRNMQNAGRYLGQAMRLMVGVPDYESYVMHMRATHPNLPVMSYEAFFRERQDARYGRGAGKCC
jgi:uncharacterized short protein YbdD (DUF466 family)